MELQADLREQKQRSSIKVNELSYSFDCGKRGDLSRGLDLLSTTTERVGARNCTACS